MRRLRNPTTSHPTSHGSMASTHADGEDLVTSVDCPKKKEPSSPVCRFGECTTHFVSIMTLVSSTPPDKSNV